MKPNVKPLAIVMISIFGFLIIVTHYSQNSRLVLTGKEMHDKVLSNDYVINKSKLLTMSDAAVIDLAANQYNRVEDSPNWNYIPLSSILDEEYVDLLSINSDKVILADDPIKAHEAWMLLTQMGYERLYVLEEEISSDSIVAQQ